MRIREVFHLGGKRIVQAAASIDRALMPMRCAFCGTKTLPHERAICDGCRGDLPWLDNPWVQRPLPITVAPLSYEFPVDAGLKALKFRRRLYYAPAFGELLLDAMRYLPDDIDAVLPVPLHWRRQAFRGFNQAAEICRPISKALHLPQLRGVCRSRATRPQSGLDAAERGRNLRQAFSVQRPVTAQHVLVIDDVITTGETVRRLAMELRRQGAGRVSVLAVARAAV